MIWKRSKDHSKGAFLGKDYKGSFSLILRLEKTYGARGGWFESRIYGWYCWSLTCSIQSTTLPSNRS
jgi:hypothetical protein